MLQVLLEITVTISQTQYSLTGVQGTTALGTTTRTAEIFDFQAVATQYSRTRTIQIPRAA